jgi:hypothetical protein
MVKNATRDTLPEEGNVELNQLLPNAEGNPQSDLEEHKPASIQPSLFEYWPRRFTLLIALTLSNAICYADRYVFFYLPHTKITAKGSTYLLRLFP